jgi:hypothetical protein
MYLSIYPLNEHNKILSSIYIGEYKWLFTYKIFYELERENIFELSVFLKISYKLFTFQSIYFTFILIINC